MASGLVIPTSPATAQPAAGTGFWRGAWRRYRRNPLAMFGAVVVTLVVLMALLAPVLTPYSYDAINPAEGLAGPSRAHPMGTDMLGRDMLTRVMYAARPMLVVGVATQLIGLLVGAVLGTVAGYAGGVLDWLITRLIDLFSALPWYLIALYMVMVLSPSVRNLIIALALTSWVAVARIVRGLTFSIREREYIVAAVALGVPTWRLLGYHIMPQAAPLLLWGFAAGIPVAVFAEAGLSFLGMGVRPPEPSWGQMLSEAGLYWQYYPHMFLFPSLMITLSVLAFQGLANGLRDALDVNVSV